MTSSYGPDNSSGFTILDDPHVYDKLDPSAMSQRLMRMAHHCRTAFDEVRAIKRPYSDRCFKAVVVAGMGGSGAVGDLVSDLALATKGIAPIFSWRDYGLPPWVNAETLIIASSYSGQTRETLSAFKMALKEGLPVIALTGGGTLESLASQQNVPVIPIRKVGEPRVSVGYSFVALTVLLERLGLLADMLLDIDALALFVDELSRDYGTTNPQSGNRAKLLANEIKGRFPVIYGGGLFAGMARLWKNNINENAKTWALADTLPELSHNGISAYSSQTKILDNATVFFLSSRLLSSALLDGYTITADLLAEAGIPNTVIESSEPDVLTQMMSFLTLGNWVSYYLAILNKVDPSPVPTIDQFKKSLGVNKGEL